MKGRVKKDGQKLDARLLLAMVSWWWSCIMMPIMVAEASSASNYPMKQRRREAVEESMNWLLEYNDEEGMSFDGTNLDEIIGLAMAKAQDKEDQSGFDLGEGAPREGDGPISSICEDTNETFLQTLDFKYTIEYFPAAHPQAIIDQLEIVLQDRLASLILECRDPDVASFAIAGEAASPPDNPEDGLCVPENEKLICRGYQGSMYLWLSDDRTAQAAKEFARNTVQQIMNDESFVIEVGQGLMNTRFGFEPGVGSVEGNSDRGSFDEKQHKKEADEDSRSFVVVSAFAGGFVFFSMILCGWSRRCFDDPTQREGGDELTSFAPDSRLVFDVDACAYYSAKEARTDDSPYSPVFPSPYYFRQSTDQHLPGIREATQDIFTHEQQYSHAFPDIERAVPLEYSPDFSSCESLHGTGLECLISTYPHSPTSYVHSATPSTIASPGDVLGIMKRYRRNDFAHDQMHNALTISDQQSSSIHDSVFDESSADASAISRANQMVLQSYVDNLLDETRDSEHHDGDLLFQEV